jgi:hypothetical protein
MTGLGIALTLSGKNLTTACFQNNVILIMMAQKNIWKRDQFKSGQNVTMDMARLHLREGVREDLVEIMRKRIEGEQGMVKGLVIEVIESLMRL